jgi:hypothetical protein
MVPDHCRWSHGDDCNCHCWHCTIGVAIDRAIVSGHTVIVDLTNQLVVPDVEVIELEANGTPIADLAGYPAVHRNGGRSCWILSPGVVP